MHFRDMPECSVEVTSMGSHVKQKKRLKKKPRSLLHIIAAVQPDIRIHKETEEINPIQLPIPGLVTEKTETGVAEIEGEKTVYIRLVMRG